MASFYTSLLTIIGRQKSQNKSYSVKLNYNLTKRTQHTYMVLAIKAYKRLLMLLFVATLSDETLSKLNFEFSCTFR